MRTLVMKPGEAYSICDHKYFGDFQFQFQGCKYKVNAFAKDERNFVVDIIKQTKCTGLRGPRAHRFVISLKETELRTIDELKGFVKEDIRIANTPRP